MNNITAVQARSLIGKKARRRAALVRRDEAVAGKCRNVAFQLQAFPVRLSDCFNNFGRRRIASVKYKTWQSATDTHLVRAHRDVLGTPFGPTVSGPVRVRFYVKRPDNRARDLDNLTKSLCDLLTRNHIIEDDSKIVDLGIAWARAEIPNDCFVHVEVEAA